MNVEKLFLIIGPKQHRKQVSSQQVMLLMLRTNKIIFLLVTESLRLSLYTIMSVSGIDHFSFLKLFLPSNLSGGHFVREAFGLLSWSLFDPVVRPEPCSKTLQVLQKNSWKKS